MGLMRFPRFYCYEGPGGAGGIGGVGAGPDGMGDPGSGIGPGNDGPGDSIGPSFGLAVDMSSPNTDSPGSIGAAQANLEAVNAMVAQNQGIKGVSNVAAVIVGLLTGSMTLAEAAKGLINQGVTPINAQTIAAKVASGNMSPQEVHEVMEGGVSDINNVAVSLRGDPLRAALTRQQWAMNQKQQATDPQSDEFWKQFVAEWQHAKKNLNEQQKFRQEQLKPAFDTYQQRLAGLSNEPTFKPINVGIGNFSTSFMPKRGMQNAQNILNSQLAETEIMDPQGANLSYLDRLGEVAQFQQQLKNKISLAEIAKREPEDKGTWLDAVADVLKVGNQVGEAWERFSK